MPSPLDELGIPPNSIGKNLFTVGDTQRGVFDAYAPDGPKRLF
jgi:hypothetical protein